MHPALKQLEHRPWPLPTQAWKWRQSWLDLAFIHYRVPAENIARLLPAGLRLQDFDGSAWVGLVPFRMAGVMRRPFPDAPYFSSFPELNLRTYVEAGGKAGVWFFSLDADSWPVVLGGRHLYDLPYFPATMRLQREGQWFSFRSVRRGGAIRFSARYRPLGNAYLAPPGTFEYWAAERYCLYSFSRRGGLSRLEVHHAPWPLQKAEVLVEENHLLLSAGIIPLPGEPVCHFSSGVHVVSFDKEAPSLAGWAGK